MSFEFNFVLASVIFKGQKPVLHMFNAQAFLLLCSKTNSLNGTPRLKLNVEFEVFILIDKNDKQWLHLFSFFFQKKLTIKVKLEEFPIDGQVSNYEIIPSF